MKQEKALELFNSELNCAQSVFSVYAEDLHLDPSIAENMACGFGAGMGKLQKTCGAVTGSFMVLSMYNSQKTGNKKEQRNRTYAMIQTFHQKFEKIHQTSECKRLTNCDLNTPEGQKYAIENNVFGTICEKCITDSIEILNELMTE